MIKVVHIAYIYGEKNTGGAAVASTRLHKALINAGCDSHYVCVKQMEKGKNIHVLPKGWRRKIFFFLTKVTRGVGKLTSHRRSIPLNVIPLWGLEKLLDSLKPDLIHVQWLNIDVASYEQVARLPYPMIFNLHDLFVVNAIEPHPFSDRRFIENFNRENSSLFERSLFRRKKGLVERVNASFMGPSSWVCDQCRFSVIGRNRNVVEVSNVVDSSFFNLDFSKKRKENKFVILFGANGGRRNRYKGFDELVLALRLLPKKVKQHSILNIFGEESEPCYTEGVETFFFGKVMSSERMAEVMGGANVFAFSSVAETQGMTKIEALLCGIPIIAFNRTACAEGVYHKENGWVAADGDIKSFAAGIVYFYEKYRRGEFMQMCKSISKSARITYDTNSIVERVKSIYQEVINENKSC